MLSKQSKNFLVVANKSSEGWRSQVNFPHTTYRSLAVRAGQADWVWTKWRRCGHDDSAEDNVEQYWWVSDETNLYNYSIKLWDNCRYLYDKMRWYLHVNIFLAPIGALGEAMSVCLCFHTAWEALEELKLIVNVQWQCSLNLVMLCFGRYICFCMNKVKMN